MSSLYDAAVALEFFTSAGKPETVGEGKTIFTESEKANPLLFKRNKVYLVLDGEVSLVARGKVIGRIGKGEIVGELAAITNAPRSATAVAKTACRVIALDDRQFAAALRKKPAFALMLMSIMIGRLRETIAQLTASGALTQEASWKESAAFDRSLLADLVRGLADDPPTHYRQGRTVMEIGQSALRMYVVLEGRVAISIGERVVERLGPGGAFGEAALVEQSTRLASAKAETDCSLLPISRKAFLALVKLSPQFADGMLSSLAQRLRFLTAQLK